jgi:microcystin degradation protein MlrC
MSESPEKFFDARGYDLAFSVADGFVWADLRQRDSSALIPKYGRGDDKPSAAARALARWHEEQSA